MMSHMLMSSGKSLYTLKLLFAINVAVFLAISLLSFFAGEAMQQAYARLALEFGGLSSAILIYTGQLWRIITTIFVHADPIHLLANMWTMYFIGDAVLTYYGGRKLFVTYVLAGIGGSLLSLILLPPLMPTIGASGAVFGLTGLLLGGMWRQQRYGMELPFRVQDILPLLMIGLLYGFTPGSNINNAAHIGGLAVGVALGYTWNHYAGAKVGTWERRIVNALFFACILLVALSLIAGVVALSGLIGVG